ncbi:tRNA (adenosine(37)-N6)-threonylcarbamoyltransferase complex ATPase subunit type 1 TsaE [Rhodobacteraceae bacterium KMM 6894]|nr:tRNA (adenosine(37)-N6)-threonylcarbamoyltransferase complex ATPase subunit type 1 TsaE [Rhodobacteraceae bacterium KMM 6894]
MLNSTSLSVHSNGPAQSCAIAATLAPRLVPSDVILLTGDIGAGKTHFARCLIQSLLHTPEDVPSPTYTLVQTYAVPTGELWHADLYRLTSTSEVFELGLIDAFVDAICLIEWPDRLGDLAPAGALHLALTQGAGDDEREMMFRWKQGDWADKLRGIGDEHT